MGITRTTIIYIGRSMYKVETQGPHHARNTETITQQRRDETVKMSAGYALIALLQLERR